MGWIHKVVTYTQTPDPTLTLLENNVWMADTAAGSQIQEKLERGHQDPKGQEIHPILVDHRPHQLLCQQATDQTRFPSSWELTKKKQMSSPLRTPANVRKQHSPKSRDL
jgi:hypothetical protein